MRLTRWSFTIAWTTFRRCSFLSFEGDPVSQVLVSSHYIGIFLFVLDHVWKDCSLPESPILRESIACNLPCAPCFCFWAKYLYSVALTWVADSDFLGFLSVLAYTHSLTHSVLVFVHTAAGRCLSRSPGRKRIMQEGKASGTVGRPSSREGDHLQRVVDVRRGSTLIWCGSVLVGPWHSTVAYQLGKEHFFGRGQKRGSV